MIHMTAGKYMHLCDVLIGPSDSARVLVYLKLDVRVSRAAAAVALVLLLRTAALAAKLCYIEPKSLYRPSLPGRHIPRA